LVCLTRDERNPRIQLAYAVGVIVLGFVCRISLTEWALIVLSIGLVLTAETINTAIERAVDHTSLETHPLARQAKDLSAAAVMIAVGASGTIGLIVFLPKWLN
jgi:diacylglycerol kinase